MEIVEMIPQDSLGLVKYSNKEFVDRLGIEIIQNVVTSILTGHNVRDLTEGLTQRRILLMNASLFVTFLKAMSSTDNFIENITPLVNKSLAVKKLTKEEETYLYWWLGLTGKSIQNVVRDDDGLERYCKMLDENVAEISDNVVSLYGQLDMNVTFDNEKVLVQWPHLLRCLLAIGAQTLTIRGSEKSMYGKIFEKLVLGSVLTLLGFNHIAVTDTTQNRQVFWLSQREDKRESDATIIVRPGTGVRFDIGFIGRGNPEISLDKVTRFETIMKRNNVTYSTATIILVDTIGDNSRITEMARAVDGYILQMSATYWVYELSEVLYRKCNYKSPIYGKTKEESIDYIRTRMRTIDLNHFIG